jgi:hypothetical protein
MHAVKKVASNERLQEHNLEAEGTFGTDREFGWAI